MFDYDLLLCEKVQKEYDAFITTLENMKPKEIIEHSYEKVMKEDIVMLCEVETLEQEKAKALYLLDCPLDAIYRYWLDIDVSYMDRLWDAIEEKAKTIIAGRPQEGRCL